MIPYRTKFRRTKISTPSRKFVNFVRFLPDFCIEILDKIFDRQNFRHQAEISTILSDELLSDKVHHNKPSASYSTLMRSSNSREYSSAAKPEGCVALEQVSRGTVGLQKERYTAYMRRCLPNEMGWSSYFHISRFSNIQKFALMLLF